MQGRNTYSKYALLAAACVFAADMGEPDEARKPPRGMAATLDLSPRMPDVFIPKPLPFRNTLTLNLTGFTMEDAPVEMTVAITHDGDPRLHKDMARLMDRVVENVIPCFTLPDMGAAAILREEKPAFEKRYKDAMEWQLRRAVAFSFPPADAFARKIEQVFREEMEAGAFEGAETARDIRVEVDTAQARTTLKTIRRILAPRGGRRMVSTPDLCP